MKKSHCRNNGFTIMEVLIFITILNIIFIAMAGFTVRLIYTMKVNEHKLRATIYAEEIKEWLNGERETDWATLYTKATPGGATYCFNRPRDPSETLANSFPQTFPPDVCNFDAVISLPPSIYRRTFVLRRIPPNQVNADIVVSWYEGATLYSSTINTVYVQ